MEVPGGRPPITGRPVQQSKFGQRQTPERPWSPPVTSFQRKQTAQVIQANAEREHGEIHFGELTQK